MNQATAANVVCPAHSRHAGDIVGCGSEKVSGPDEEGMYDCIDCGLFFNPDVEMAAKATDAFKRYEDLLSKVRKGGTAKGAERTVAMRAYRNVLVELQPLGEWSLEQVRGLLTKVRDAVPLPPGYSARMTDADRRFVAGEINTPDDVSLWVRKEGAALTETDQFSFEVRVFLNRPSLIVFFTVGEQHSFVGRRVNVFKDGPRANAETYATLADMTIDALKQAIEAEGFC